ncbi:DUF1302 domain-containing protein [Piscinibacter sakaiensis]|uniref:DUF1302 domain-containing protein n=1 Tax=Piscinibacter sakaiensis TaxID=1547922 RepID=UPI003AAB0656
MQTKRKTLRAHSGPAAAAMALTAAVATILAAAPAGAFELDTGNPDFSVRWDNTPRVNLGVRVEKRNDLIGNNQLYDEGTYSFDRGDMVAKRLDWFSELDVVYKKRFGARVSAQFWYDGAYGSASRANPTFAAISSYAGNRYTDYTRDLYRGADAEVLDAFVFGRVDLGEVPLRFKLGRHTLYWGESLFVNGNLNSIAYAQNPLDLQKGFATPGAEAKELFRPLNQISAQASVTDELTLMAQYYLEWDSFRYPEGGTYLGPVDFAFRGPQRQSLGAPLGFASNGGNIDPSDRGDWGIGARWSPQWLDGTLGFYYRNYSDKLPQSLLTRVGAGTSQYNLIYGDDIDLFGISLAKNVGGLSLGAELSYRRNTPLNAVVLGNAAPAGVLPGGQTAGPRGDTVHGLVNVLGVLPKTALFDAATWAAELTWAHLASVKSGSNLFMGEGYTPCVGRSKWDGCSTRNYLGVSAAFTPTWYQVMPGVDLSMPIAFYRGLSGNAPTVFGGNQKNGNYSIGLSADVYQKYRIELKYIDYFGHTSDNGRAVTGQNGFTSLLKDRGFINLTFKTTF